jgi:hypothetical protein
MTHDAFVALMRYVGGFRLVQWHHARKVAYCLFQSILEKIEEGKDDWVWDRKVKRKDGQLRNNFCILLK